MRLLDLFYPPRCTLCHAFVPSSRVKLCDSCSVWVLHQKPVRKKLRFADACFAPLPYEEPLRSSIHRFKFAGRVYYAPVYADWMAANILENAVHPFDCITYAPVSRRRKLRRGYDQAEKLARALAERLELPALRMLRKQRNNPPQSKTGTAQSRRANVLGVYAPVHPEAIAGKRVLLIDDIITTGATAEECARVLLTAGASSVSCAAIAAVK